MATLTAETKTCELEECGKSFNATARPQGGGMPSGQKTSHQASTAAWVRYAPMTAPNTSPPLKPNSFATLSP